MTPNERYEKKMLESGRKKVTLWLPVDRESEIKEAITAMCLDEDLTIKVLSSLSTGRFVSLSSV